MQVHGDDVVSAGHAEHVGNELGGDGSSALVLLVLSCVGIDRYDCGDTGSRCNLASVDHDQKLHDVVVDLATAALDDKDVLASNRLANLHAKRPTQAQSAQVPRPT